MLLRLLSKAHNRWPVHALALVCQLFLFFFILNLQHQFLHTASGQPLDLSGHSERLATSFSMQPSDDPPEVLAEVQATLSALREKHDSLISQFAGEAEENAKLRLLLEKQDRELGYKQCEIEGLEMIIKNLPAEPSDFKHPSECKYPRGVRRKEFG